jgi:hypothetical protein
MMLIRIPRTAKSRGERTYAQLILRVPRRPRIRIFEGRVFFRCGVNVERDALRPNEAYPATPLLLEYAGNDRTGRGHNRSNDIHVLWRFNAQRGEFDEIARAVSQGPEWFYHLAPIALREIEKNAAPTPIDFVQVAAAVTSRVLAILDTELDSLEDEGRDRVMSFLYDQFTARLVA